MSVSHRRLQEARTVADAVLYEGYLLYPYRASSEKNRTRWQFGVLGPPGAADRGLGEADTMSMTILLNGVLRNATGLYGKVLDVNNITQSASFPLQEFKTTIGKSTSTYIQAKCPTTPWHTQVTWTYNDNTKKTVSKTQPCT